MAGVRAVLYQIDLYHTLAATKIVQIIDFFDGYWSPNMQSPASVAETFDVIATGTIRQIALLREMVAVSLDLPGLALVVYTRHCHPAIFYLADGSLRCHGVDFDFPSYSAFKFDKERVRLINLSDEDKTLIRLSHQMSKPLLRDGTQVERVG